MWIENTHLNIIQPEPEPSFMMAITWWTRAHGTVESVKPPLMITGILCEIRGQLKFFLNNHTTWSPIVVLQDWSL